MWKTPFSLAPGYSLPVILYGDLRFACSSSIQPESMLASSLVLRRRNDGNAENWCFPAGKEDARFNMAWE